MTRVESCGCRYSPDGVSNEYIEKCDYLCDKHKDEFILKIYNSQFAIQQYKKLGY